MDKKNFGFIMEGAIFSPLTVSVSHTCTKSLYDNECDKRDLILMIKDKPHLIA